MVLMETREWGDKYGASSQAGPEYDSLRENKQGNSVGSEYQPQNSR